MYTGYLICKNLKTSFDDRMKKKTNIIYQHDFCSLPAGHSRLRA